MAENNQKSIIRLSEVLSVDDSQAGLRIKVRLWEDSKSLYPTTEDLPYCYPLIPKHVHLNPKVGECVLVILATLDSANSQRFFIGPLISQQYALNFDPYYYQSRSLLDGGNSSKPLPDPSMNSDNNGSYPDKEDVAIQGRQNTDLILKDNEVRLRCGFKKYPNGKPIDTLLFNREDLSYIQMRYKKSKDQNNKDYSSAINIVADRINLLSHDSKNNFNLNDPKSLITDEEMLKILQNAHPLPYGDELIDFLKKFVELFRVHTHPIGMDPPSFDKPQLDILQTNLDDFLSQSIKIN